LSELVAGAEIGLLGFDFQPPEVLSALLKDGVLRSGIRPEPGTDVRICVEDVLEWRTLVPFKGGALAHADGRKAISLSHAEAMLHPVDRGGLYRTMVDDLSCRPDIRELAVGIWQLGTFQHPDGTRAKVVIVEQGTPPDTVAQQVQALQYTCIFLLGMGKATVSLDSLNRIAGKTILHGQLGTDGDRFYCTAMDEAEDLATPSHPDTYIDINAKPPVLVVNGVSLQLPMNQSNPATGVLLLNYLFEHPCAVVPSWKLELEVFPEKRSHQDTAFGTDPVSDEKAVASIRTDAEKAARELAFLRRKRDASQSEIKSAEDEVERLMDALNASRTSRGRKQQLGESSSESARQRVKNNLRKVFDEVQKQDAKIGEQLKSAVRQGYEVMFLPPPDWGM
jgi:hypothetical protein